MSTHHTIHRVMPPAERHEPLPRYVRPEDAERYYTQPRYLWVGTFIETEHKSLDEHLAEHEAESGFPHVAQISDSQPGKGES